MLFGKGAKSFVFFLVISVVLKIPKIPLAIIIFCLGGVTFYFSSVESQFFLCNGDYWRSTYNPRPPPCLSREQSLGAARDSNSRVLTSYHCLRTNNILRKTCCELQGWTLCNDSLKISDWIRSVNCFAQEISHSGLR